MKILRKKKFDSSKNLTSEIEQILMKGKKLSKNVFLSLLRNQQDNQKIFEEGLMMP